MKKYEYVGVYPTTNDSGIGIVEIDTYGEWVKFQWFTRSKVWKLTKAPLLSEYNIETGCGDFYFNSFKRKFYLKDFMRTNL